MAEKIAATIIGATCCIRGTEPSGSIPDLMQDFSIVSIQQNTEGILGFFGVGFDIPAPVIVGNDLAVHLQHQLSDFTAVDAKLISFRINPDPVIN